MNKIKWLKKHVLMIVIGTFLLGSTAALGFSYQFVLARNQVAATSSPVIWHSMMKEAYVKQTYASIASGYTQYSICNDASPTQIISESFNMSNANPTSARLKMKVGRCDQVRLRAVSVEVGSGSYEVHGVWSPNEVIY